MATIAPASCMDSPGRVELVAEEARDSLEALISNVRSTIDAVSIDERWQLPVGGYQAEFPVFELAPKMRAEINLNAEDAGTLDYISRHCQIEAVQPRPQAEQDALDAAAA